MATTSAATSMKRKNEDLIVDPDTLKPIEDSKKTKIDLNEDRKFRCISSIVDMYEKILYLAFGEERLPQQTMDVDSQITGILSDAMNSITVGNHIISIIFTMHNVCRQAVKVGETNMIKKTERTSFKIHFRGKDYMLPNEVVKAAWGEVLIKNRLNYNDFEITDPENWYGTMGPYLDMFSSYALRVNELRLGHNNMPITKVDGVHKSFPVSKYGLSGAHHVLLEGTSFPPERRSSIVQSLGPMTSWLCMIRSEGMYRRKYAAAVKRSMAHVPCIDDIIELTKNTKKASEIATLTTLVAEILLVTTARQATRMFFPITIFAAVWGSHNDKAQFCNFFNTTGAGGWYTYKKACELKRTFTIGGMMQAEMGSQIVFHGIFGTFKEDLAILSQITDVGTWYTREDMGQCFRQQGNATRETKIILPRVKYYSKMSCANQSGLLSGVYNQVVTVPCFSGSRIHSFDSTFFDHIEKKRVISTTGKTLSQIINILTSTLEDLHDRIRKSNGRIDMGTTKWRDMGTLTLGNPGDEIEIKLEGKSKKFLGKN